MQWPNGSRFAFTVFDDTDNATIQNVKPVYDLLTDLGMRTTKSVWIFDSQGKPGAYGATCENRSYLEWVLSLQRSGFEIGLHCVAPSTSPRERTRVGLSRFRELFGERPMVHCNHVGCAENIYWGDARLSGCRRGAYNLMTLGKNRGVFRGHIEGDPLFWGDLCQDNVTYVRNFVFDKVNTLAVCPVMPYHDEQRPYVNFWFAGTNGGTLDQFLRNYTFESIDRLVDEGGLSIAYVHFAFGFAYDGKVEKAFRARLEYMASKSGWFAPVSTVLDYLRGGRGCSQCAITPAQLRALEMRWLIEKIRKRRTD